MGDDGVGIMALEQFRERVQVSKGVVTHRRRHLGMTCSHIESAGKLQP
jgi:hypothetical protein